MLSALRGGRPRTSSFPRGFHQLSAQWNVSESLSVKQTLHRACPGLSSFSSQNNCDESFLNSASPLNFAAHLLEARLTFIRSAKHFQGSFVVVPEIVHLWILLQEQIAQIFTVHVFVGLLFTSSEITDVCL